MNILCACEESQAVTLAFRKAGHNAFSCDIQDCSGGHPEYHIKTDVTQILNGFCLFTTCDNRIHIEINNRRWDMIIAFPPCTYLTYAGNHVWNAPGREEKRQAAIEFFMKFVNAKCNKIIIENPLGVMSKVYRKSDQIVHPYYFGDPYKKRTCLWYKGLPLLNYGTDIVKPPDAKIHPSGKKSNFIENVSGKDRAKIRSKTFPGIANALALQYG